MSRARLWNFTPFRTFREWLAEYRSDIRVSVDWDLLCAGRHPKVYQAVDTFPDGGKVQLPWYKKGSWRDGEREIASCGDEPFAVRVPAVELPVHGGVLVLDGCHRITQLQPSIIVLDILVLTTTKHRYAFNDLLGAANAE